MSSSLEKLWCQNDTEKNKSGGRINDIWQSPYGILEPVYKYIKKYKTIWEPCSLPDGSITRYLREKKHKVKTSDILEGPEYDYNTYLPKGKIDLIVSNPPFSKKVEFLKRLFEIGIPFVVVLPVRVLETNACKGFFNQYGHVTIFIPWEKINYVKPEEETGKCFFHSCFVMYKMSKETLIIEAPPKSLVKVT